ncbi:MAG: VWA domain-containing protein [Planctomycetota bacterium]
MAGSPGSRWPSGARTAGRILLAAPAARGLLLMGLLVAAPVLARAEDEGDAPFPDAERAAAALGSTREARRAAARSCLRTADIPPDRATRVARALARALAVARDTDRPDERRELVELLTRVDDPLALDALLAHLDPEEEPDERVWAAAVDGIATRADDAALARALVTSVADDDAPPLARALRLELLGSLHHPAATLRLLLPRAGETWPEAATRARALAKQPTSQRLEGLVALLGHEALGVRRVAWEGLSRATGWNLPAEHEVWKEAFLHPPQEEAEGRYAKQRPVHVPRYYGIPIPRPGSAVVFCLDVSQSMYGRGIDLARAHLHRTIHDLPATHRFAIAAFHTGVRVFADRLVESHPVQKARALAWLDALDTTAYTNMIEALDWAYGLAGRGPAARDPAETLDAVFLLSDGAPNRGRITDEKRLVEVVRAYAAGDLPLNTIGAGEEVFPLLQAMATAGGGQFVDAFE